MHFPAASGSRMAVLSGLPVVCGAMEFLCSALLDCLETGRHLFLFHVITELLIVCAVAGLLNLTRNPRSATV